MSDQRKEPNILIVDDNLANLQILISILEECNYLIRPTNSGTLALKSVRISPPNLILLDIMMPEVDGYEVCEIFKVDEVLCDISIIFISALDDVTSKVEGFRVGGADYITKPCQPEQVIARIDTQLEIQQLHQFDKLNIVFSNQEAKSIFAYPSDETLGKSLDILIPQYGRDIHKKHVSQFVNEAITCRP